MFVKLFKNNNLLIIKSGSFRAIWGEEKYWGFDFQSSYYHEETLIGWAFYIENVGKCKAATHCQFSLSKPQPFKTRFYWIMYQFLKLCCSLLLNTVMEYHDKGIIFWILRKSLENVLWSGFWNGWLHISL